MLYSLTAYADSMGKALRPSFLSSLYIGAFGGYGNIHGAYKQDRNFAQGMLILGFRPVEYRHFLFGIEAGGGLPIQGTLKPILDFLVTVKSPLPTYQPVSLIVHHLIANLQ